MTWVRLLFLLLVLAASVVSATGFRKCAQCVSGTFLAKKYLMQDSSIKQSMGFVDQWEGTNCVSGPINKVLCENSCVQITLKRINSSDDSYEGTMSDCSDELIHASPDLPQDINFRAFTGDVTYWNVRRKYNITYIFSTHEPEDVEKTIQETHKSIELPTSPKKMSMGNRVALGIFCLVFLVLFVVLGYHCCVQCLGKSPVYEEPPVHYRDLEEQDVDRKSEDIEATFSSASDDVQNLSDS